MSVLTSSVSEIEFPGAIPIAKNLIFLGLFSLMLFIPVLNQCFCAAIFLVFISGTWRRDWRLILQDKIILTSLILVLLFTIGMFYSQGSWGYTLRAWNKYLKILYLLFFLPLFAQKKIRVQAIHCFIASIMISELFSYLHYFNVVNLGFPATKHWLFVQDIDSGFIVSFASYLLLSLAIDNQKFRWLYLTFFLICSVDVLLLNQERTGYLIYISLVGLFLLQRFHWKGIVSAIIVIPLLFSTLYFGSVKFQTRINQVVHEIKDYRGGNETTSIGLRLSFTQYSLRIIRQHLFFGAGTGSFEEIYRALNGPKINNQTWPAHPHNEYIAILFQLGFTGFLVFVYWLYLQIRASFTLPTQEKYLLQGLLLGFLLLGFCNASLLVNPAGACYMTFLAIFLAPRYDQQQLVMACE